MDPTTPSAPAPQETPPTLAELATLFKKSAAAGSGFDMSNLAQGMALVAEAADREARRLNDQNVRLGRQVQHDLRQLVQAISAVDQRLTAALSGDVPADTEDEAQAQDMPPAAPVTQQAQATEQTAPVVIQAAPQPPPGALEVVTSARRPQGSRKRAPGAGSAT